MNSKIAAILMLLAFAASSGSAVAQHGGHAGAGHGGGGHVGGYSHGGGYGHGGHGRGFGYGVGVGIALGLPFYWPSYYPGYYPYAYAAPAYAYPTPDYAYPAPAYAGGYVEQGYAAAPPAPQQDWYFCPASNAYYPYVQECPGGWQRVPSQPPSR